MYHKGGKKDNQSCEISSVLKEKNFKKIALVATVDLLMFLSSLLWQDGMFDFWLLPHNITVLYASACPHCSWSSLCWWLNKKKKKKEKWQRKVESYPLIIWVVITSPIAITAEFLNSVANPQDACGYVKIKTLTDFFGYAPPFSQCTSAQTQHYCIAS